MGPGDVIAGRFVIEDLAGEGGMGVVYRARDAASGAPVALKLMRGGGAERFARESETLAVIRHPRIVGHVAHGHGAEGPWLAMEWLEGELLSQRLARGRTSVGEALEIAAAAAEGLAALHARGIVHRDVKPSNLLLAGGEARGLKLLDFGMVRRDDPTLTRSGAIVGTPAYLAPERVRGAGDPDPRADVFALGCVLFECLTGRQAFRGDHPVVLLAKILLEPTPRAGAARPDLPPEVDALAARLMAKDEGDRPRDAAEALAEILAVSGGGAPPLRSARSAPPALSLGEQRMVSVILALAEGARGPETIEASTSTPSGGEAPALRAVAARFGARLEELGGGALAATIELRGSASDHAAQAARCALVLAERLPGGALALATGRAEIAGGLPVGDAIDRAAALLARRGHAAPPGGGVWIDEDTAGLLDGRFDLGEGPCLAAERAEADTERPLLGRASPFVGREHEISFLLDRFEDCASEPRARAALVTGPPGIGKSRLAREIRRRLGERADAVAVLLARGDPLGAGSPFGLVGTALRHAAGIAPGERRDVAREKLRARVAENVPADDAPWVTEFLGELAGAPFPDEASPRLAAARRAPVLMADQIRATLRAFLDAECARGPVLLVLEDAHWGDEPSLRLVDHAIRRLAARPLFVLALARPEMLGRAPELGPEADTLKLGALPRRASEALARAALGPSAPRAEVARLCERGAGNALYLEELVRAAASGRSADLPGSVLAVIASRLDALEPGARRVLRAGSVLGQQFRSDGVAWLLGGEARRDEARAALAALVDAEMVELRGEARAGEGYAFRHALFRDAAYALLTDADRALGHRLAGEWLERAGGEDPATLAEHFERGGQTARAARFLLDAAEQAWRRNEARAAIDFAQRSIAFGLEGEALGRARLVEARARIWLAELDAAGAAVSLALPLLARGSDPWCEAVCVVGHIALSKGPRERLLALADELDAGGEGAAYLNAYARVATMLAFAGELRRAEQMADAVGARGGEDGDPLIRAPYLQARATLACYSGQPHAALDLLERSARCFEELGDARGAAIQRGNWGSVAIEFGGHAEAERALRDAIAVAERIGLQGALGTGNLNLGFALALLGRLDEARRHEEEAVRILEALGEERLLGAARTCLSTILLLAGEPEAAEAEAARAVELLAMAPPLRAGALAALAEARLARGRVDEALAAAGEGHAILTSLGAIEERESLVQLAWVEALDRSDRRAEAAAVAAEAAERLRRRAERIEDPAWRERFLASPDNARLLALAARLG